MSGIAAEIDPFTDQAAPAHRLVKLVSDRELQALRMVCRELPEITAEFLECAPMSDDASARGPWLVLMRDCAGDEGTLTEVMARSKGCGAVDRTILDMTLARLAKLHGTFSGRSVELSDAGLPPAPIARPAPTPAYIADVIEASARLALWAPKTKDRVLEAGRRLACGWSGFVGRLADDRRHTLVHGDFHFDNVVVDPGGRPVIIDWGAALVANPCWDLVFFGPADLVAYRTHGGPEPLADWSEFLEDLRAAVALRMFGLLETAIVGPASEACGDAIASAVRVVGRNLATVAQSRFKGGLGFAPELGAGRSGK